MLGSAKGGESVIGGTRREDRPSPLPRRDGGRAAAAQVPRLKFDRRRRHASRPRREGEPNDPSDPSTWKEPFVTRALRSQELWLTLGYLGLLLLMAKGFAA